MADNAELTEKFKRAANHVRHIVGKFSSDELLELYAYYKQALEGPCKLSKPWWFDVTAKQKWEAWKRLKDMDSETAMKKYVCLVCKSDPDWNIEDSDEDSHTSEGNGPGWVAVSSMANTDDFLSDADKTIFDWVKEGNVQKVLETANRFQECDVNARDSDGMGLIHWAADRGNVEMLQCLVENLNADVNLKDGDGQTALHYAASCGHSIVMHFLLQHGGDPNIADVDGTFPSAVASDSEIADALTAAAKGHVKMVK